MRTMRNLRIGAIQLERTQSAESEWLRRLAEGSFWYARLEEFMEDIRGKRVWSGEVVECGKAGSVVTSRSRSVRNRLTISAPSCRWEAQG